MHYISGKEIEIVAKRQENTILSYLHSQKENRFIKTAFNYYTLIDIDATLHAECRCERRHE